ncbi:plasma membrane proteolipid 3 [Gigaspora margarita]|uniref:Plasma membrane proteolipid 3 n=1 Tax=Gigaspora margarita TaxID=4874 RepID=A0A8H4B2Z6_GIGMA|nr:plasma membrane proteolipid 3 [Gigaspora margarita]
MAEYSSYDILAMVVSFFLPPVGVFMKRGCHADLCINCLLTILGHIPGIIHAFYIVYKYRDDAANPNKNPNRNRNAGNVYQNQNQNQPSVAIPIDDGHTTASRQNEKSMYQSPGDQIPTQPTKELPPSSKFPESVVHKNIPKTKSPGPHYGTHTIEDSDPNRYKR